jgi:hypothetical protein
MRKTCSENRDHHIEVVRRGNGPPGIARYDYSLAMVIKKWKDRTILGYPGAENISRLLADGFPKALHHAIESGSAPAPERILYRYQGVERTASREECLSFAM